MCRYANHRTNPYVTSPPFAILRSCSRILNLREDAAQLAEGLHVEHGILWPDHVGNGRACPPMAMTSTLPDGLPGERRILLLVAPWLLEQKPQRIVGRTRMMEANSVQ